MRTVILAALVALGGCADYQFTVNDRVVYSPDPLFADYEVADEALEACLKQTIADYRVTNRDQLEELFCTHAGISDLTGLQVFTGLARLKLSSNAITELGPLAVLAQLSTLELEGNQVRSLLSLRGLLKLSYLGLEGNDTLNCAELNHFRAISQLEITPPEHCS